LAPRRFSRAALDALRRDVGSLVWNAEYQGVPRAPEGDRFKRGWFPIVEASPEVMARVRYWDKAATEGGGKFSAGVLIGRSAERQTFIEDVARGQWSTGHRRAAMLQTAQLDAARYGNTVRIYIEQEPGSSGKDSVDDEIRMLGAFPVHADRPTGDKDTRLEPFRAQAEGGNVKLVRGTWNQQAYIEEMCAIPNGTFRDQADATAGGYNKLASVLDGKLVY
jgi:predicted phage terminase large subunit-like protein